MTPQVAGPYFAALREHRLEDGRTIPRGWLGRETGGAPGTVAFSCGAAVPRCAITIAQVRLDGHMPAPGDVGVLFSALVGSRAHGLSSKDSDTDRRGFYVAGPRVHFSLEGPPDQLVHDEDQVCYWEFGKFLRLALACNPTVLEALYSPAVELASPIVARGLIELRDAGGVLSLRARLTFMGYADAQFLKMTRARERGGTFAWRHAMHLIRLLRAGTDLLRTGRLDVRVSDEHRDELLAIKRGERTWGEVCRLREALSSRFEAAAASSPLPAEPEFERAERLLMDVRRHVWCDSGGKQ